MSDPSDLSNDDLRNELISLGFTPGAIQHTTRSVYEKKLVGLRGGGRNAVTTSAKASNRRHSPRKSAASSPISPPNNVSMSPTAPAFQPLVTPQLPPKPLVSKSNSTRNKQPVFRAPPQPETSDNELDEHVVLAESPKTNFKRTPTPNRPTTFQRTGSGGRNEYSSGSVNSNNVPRQPTRSPVSNYTPFYSEDADKDDQMESSRIFTPTEQHRRHDVPPSSRVRQRTSPKEDSPVGMLQRSFESAVNYFSKKARTPQGYQRHPSERGHYGTPGGRFSPLARRRGPTPPTSSDIPKWIMICFASFTFILAISYIFTAHPKTVERSTRVIGRAISDTIAFFYNYAIFPVLVLVLTGAFSCAVFYLYQNRKATRLSYQRKTMELVDQIADRVRNMGTKGMAEQHLRDILIPPTRRTDRDWTLWNSAVDFVNNQDSRMRSESRLINGVECNVWIWVTAPDANTTWQGPAERSPQAIHAPEVALTRCLKVRGMIESQRAEDDAQLQREIYNKLWPIIPVHVALTHGNDACVYLRLATMSDSKIAFDKLTAQWYRDTLLNVKYVRDERYAERFPEVSAL